MFCWEICTRFMWKYLVWKWNSMIKIAQKKTAKEWGKLRARWNKTKNYPLFDYNSVLGFCSSSNNSILIEILLPKKQNPFNYLSIYVILKQSIAKEKDLDDSIWCSYYKKRVMMLKVFSDNKMYVSTIFISLIKIKPSISICSCTSDDSILLNYYIE